MEKSIMFFLQSSLSIFSDWYCSLVHIIVHQGAETSATLFNSELFYLKTEMSV